MLLSVHGIDLIFGFFSCFFCCRVIGVISNIFCGFSLFFLGVFSFRIA